MATGDDQPELAFCAKSRQRLVRQLLQTQMAQNDYGSAPAEGRAVTDHHDPDRNAPDRYQEPT